jgi:hypothetical protein
MSEREQARPLADREGAIGIKPATSGRFVQIVAKPPSARKKSEPKLTRVAFRGPGALHDAFDAAVTKANGRAGEGRLEAANMDAGSTSDWWRTKLIKASDLCDRQFPDLKYVIPGIFPEGVTLLASRPKLGKSWLLLQVGTAVATGVFALVPDDNPLHGDVLTPPHEIFRSRPEHLAVAIGHRYRLETARPGRARSNRGMVQVGRQTDLDHDRHPQKGSSAKAERAI